jgi:predicted nucleic acid-binding protein
MAQIIAQRVYQPPLNPRPFGQVFVPGETRQPGTMTPGSGPGDAPLDTAIVGEVNPAVTPAYQPSSAPNATGASTPGALPPAQGQLAGAECTGGLQRFDGENWHRTAVVCDGQEDGHPTILADTNFLITAFGGDTGAQDILLGANTFVTPGVYYEFLHVSEEDAPARQQFLTDMGIQLDPFGSAIESGTYQSVYNEVLRAGHSPVDADLLATAAHSGYTVFTEEGRLSNFVYFSRPAKATPISIDRFLP